MNDIILTITTPEKILFNGTVQKVSLPGSAGTFQILKDHAPLISTLQPGSITYQQHTQQQQVTIQESIVEVFNNTITVLTAPL